MLNAGMTWPTRMRKAQGQCTTVKVCRWLRWSTWTEQSLPSLWNILFPSHWSSRVTITLTLHLTALNISGYPHLPTSPLRQQPHKACTSQRSPTLTVSSLLPFHKQPDRRKKKKTPPTLTKSHLNNNKPSTCQCSSSSRLLTLEECSTARCKCILPRWRAVCKSAGKRGCPVTVLGHASGRLSTGATRVSVSRHFSRKQPRG